MNITCHFCNMLVFNKEHECYFSIIILVLLIYGCATVLLSTYSFIILFKTCYLMTFFHHEVLFYVMNFMKFTFGNPLLVCCVTFVFLVPISRKFIFGTWNFHFLKLYTNYFRLSLHSIFYSKFPQLF